MQIKSLISDFSVSPETMTNADRAKLVKGISDLESTLKSAIESDVIDKSIIHQDQEITDKKYSELLSGLKVAPIETQDLWLKKICDFCKQMNISEDRLRRDLSTELHLSKQSIEFLTNVLNILTKIDGLFAKNIMEYHLDRPFVQDFIINLPLRPLINSIINSGIDLKSNSNNLWLAKINKLHEIVSKRSDKSELLKELQAALKKCPEENLLFHLLVRFIKDDPKQTTLDELKNLYKLLKYDENSLQMESSAILLQLILQNNSTRVREALIDLASDSELPVIYRTNALSSYVTLAQKQSLPVLVDKFLSDAKYGMRVWTLRCLLTNELFGNESILPILQKIQKEEKSSSVELLDTLLKIGTQFETDHFKENHKLLLTNIMAHFDNLPGLFHKIDAKPYQPEKAFDSFLQRIGLLNIFKYHLLQFKNQSGNSLLPTFQKNIKYFLDEVLRSPTLIRKILSHESDKLLTELKQSFGLAS